MGSTDKIEDLSASYDIDLPTKYSAYIAVIFEKTGNVVGRLCRVKQIPKSGWVHVAA